MTWLNSYLVRFSFLFFLILFSTGSVLASSASSSCSFSDPVDFSGSTPTSSSTPFQFASVDCVYDISDVVVSNASSSDPLYVQDSGNVSFGLAVIIFFLAIIFFGLVRKSFSLHDS